MSQTDRLTHKDAVLKVLPHYDLKIQRLEKLAVPGALPVVTVVGKYNHGKSSLLNTLMGQQQFTVADKRETRSLSQVDHEGIRWIDAPGLDADVHEVDDSHAEQALWVESDVRLFVHAAKEGELDKSELELQYQLVDDELTSQRQSLFVMTQVDQVESDADMQAITDILSQQLDGRTIYPVSSMRYNRGVERDQEIFIQNSGIPTLTDALYTILKQVPAARAHEQQHYLSEMTAELADKHAFTQSRYHELHNKANETEASFMHDMLAMIEQGAEDLKEILKDPPIDYSLQPDTKDDLYRMTAAKQDRNRLHVAYSRACLLMRSVLLRYGMNRITTDDYSNNTSLATVMVAVMGVNVKYRSHLRAIFGTPEARQNLLTKFKYYFDISERRLAALNAVQEQKELLQAIEVAQETVKNWAD